MFFSNSGYSLLLSHSHPFVAKLAGVKRMYEGKVFEMGKRKKRKLEETQLSVAKVCSLLVVLS